MDPFSALGVAAAVVQFVDYGTLILSNARDIYQLNSSRHARVETASEDIVRLADEGDAKFKHANAGSLVEPRSQITIQREFSSNYAENART